MNYWKVIWWNGSTLMETVVFADAYSVVSMASSQGASTYSIVEMKRVPQSTQQQQIGSPVWPSTS
jgi:hypothetical protein